MRFSRSLYTIEHDSEHDMPYGMRDQTDRSVFFDETEIAFLDSDVA